MFAFHLFSIHYGILSYEDPLYGPYDNYKFSLFQMHSMSKLSIGKAEYI